MNLIGFRKKLFIGDNHPVDINFYSIMNVLAYAGQRMHFFKSIGIHVISPGGINVSVFSQLN